MVEKFVLLVDGHFFDIRDFFGRSRNVFGQVRSMWDLLPLHPLGTLTVILGHFRAFWAPSGLLRPDLGRLEQFRDTLVFNHQKPLHHLAQSKLVG